MQNQAKVKEVMCENVWGFCQVKVTKAILDTTEAPQKRSGYRCFVLTCHQTWSALNQIYKLKHISFEKISNSGTSKTLLNFIKKQWNITANIFIFHTSSD